MVSYLLVLLVDVDDFVCLLCLLCLFGLLFSCCGGCGQVVVCLVVIGCCLFVYLFVLFVVAFVVVAVVAAVAVSLLSQLLLLSQRKSALVHLLLCERPSRKLSPGTSRRESAIPRQRHLPARHSESLAGSQERRQHATWFDLSFGLTELCGYLLSNCSSVSQSSALGLGKVEEERPLGVDRCQRRFTATDTKALPKM